MSTNIFKTPAKNSRNNNNSNNINSKNNNNRFNSLKDELVLKQDVIFDEKIVKKPIIEEKSSRFNFDKDEVNLFTIEDVRDVREKRYNSSSNSFMNIKPTVTKIVKIEPFIYKEELFPSLLTDVEVVNQKVVNQKVVNQKVVNLELKLEVKEVKCDSLVDKLKLKYKEDIEKNQLKEDEIISDDIEPGCVAIRYNPDTNKRYICYGNNIPIIPIVPKTNNLNECMWDWVDNVSERFKQYKQQKDDYYGQTYYDYDYDNPEENYAEYFDMLDKKEERELLKEEARIQLMLNSNDSDNYETDYN